jgi:adiponectin receptor
MSKIPHIETGYRINYDSNIAILKSLFMVHNEMVNCWTHLIGAILSLILGFSIYMYFNEAQQLI